MVSYCCVKGCNNNSKNKKKDPSSLISFHAFPSNQEVKTKWLRAIGRPTWMPPNHARVCSAHFNYDQINYDGCRIRIKDDACPVNLLPLNSNFEASNVEACRICLAIDVKMHSLRDSHLDTCMDSVAGFSQNYNIDGLPQFVCYQCAPCLIKWNKLIEKSMIAQATLLDIFAKNGKITKSLIKEQNRAELNLKTSLDSYFMIDDYYMKYDDGINTSQIIKSNTVANENNNLISLKNESDTTYCEMKLREFKTDPDDFENMKCVSEANESELIEINNDSHDDDVSATRMSTTTEDVTLDNDLKEDFQLNDQKEKKVQVKLFKKKLVKKKGYDLTPDETEMLKYFDIVKLSLHEQIQEWEKNTVRRPLTSETIYECEICYKAFANVNSYRVHVTCHDPSHGSAECSVCKLRFKNSVMAATHAKRAHGKKFFCKSCPKAFNNVGVAKKHQRWHSGYLYKCDKCSFSSLHESSLGVHKRRAHCHALTCSTCGQTCSSRRGLDIHTHTAHRTGMDTDVTKEYRCEECKIDFVSEGARRVHILTSSQHRKKPDLCDATVQDSSLQNTCKKCGTECASIKELVSHTRAEHPRSNRHRWRGDTYPTTCQLCGEAISSRKKHWHHVRRQHPKEIDTYQPVITAVCDTCGKGFQNSTKLRLHQLRHGSPTVRCHSCPRMFYDKYALARHACTHNADKPHQCRTCARTFKLRSNLERHFRVHTDNAPYECTMCGKKFKYSSSVNLHVRTVHYKLPHPPRKKRSKSVKDVDL